MENAMFQLKSFVHQRLYSAAEEILGEVQKTVTFALYEAEVSRSKDEIERLRHQLDLLRNNPATETSETISTLENGDECNVPLRQENPRSSTPEESNSSPGAELPGSFQTSAESENAKWNHSLVQTDFGVSVIKEEQEEVGGDTQTNPSGAEPSMTISTVKEGDYHGAPWLQENVGSSTQGESNLSQTQEQDQAEAQVEYELQPLSSDFSDGEIQNNGFGEDLVNSKETGTETMKKTGKKLQRKSFNKNGNDHAALTNDKKGQSLCHVCGKAFKYMGSLINHIKIHEKTIDCTFCGKKYQSAKQLSIHMKSHQDTKCFCGMTFANNRRLRLHEKTHEGQKDFTCRDCGKTFAQKAELIVHLRTHSGEKPYHCDICGKAFSQNSSFEVHKRRHSSKKPYRCDRCGKLFITRKKFQMHIKNHTAETLYSCDVCGKGFCHNGSMTNHRNRPKEKRSHGCSICGKRYKFLSVLKAHMKNH